MSVHRSSKADTDAARPATGTRPAAPAAGTPASAPIGPVRSLEEAEERYVAARDAWTAAMRKANSGRPADLASLALRQETYELATAEVERWRAGIKVAIPVEPRTRQSGLEAAIGQELAWRHVHEHPEKARGLLARLGRRLTGRG